MKHYLQPLTSLIKYSTLGDQLVTSVLCAKVNLRGMACKPPNGTPKCGVIFFLTFIAFQVTNSNIIYVTSKEGESALLDFPYPCNSSRVTFQYRNRALSYDSANPTSVSLPPNQNLTIKNESENNKCSLHLTIYPVSRDDEGPYIVFAYENGNHIDARIVLRVNYPPGKVSCESSDQYIEGWIRLQCSAQAGNLAGQIVCYQNNIRLPPLTPPVENNGILSQNILAMSSNSAKPIYCCSSTVHDIKVQCECHDSGWDPMLNKAITNVEDPCYHVGSVTTTHVSTWSSDQTESSELPETTIAQACTTQDYLLGLLLLLSLILILTCVVCISHGMQYFRMKRLELAGIKANGQLSHL